jgi:hypothetical protein
LRQIVASLSPIRHYQTRALRSNHFIGGHVGKSRIKSFRSIIILACLANPMFAGATANRFKPDPDPGDGGNWGVATRWSAGTGTDLTQTLELSGRLSANAIDLNLRTASGIPANRSAMNLALAATPATSEEEYVTLLRRARRDAEDTGTNSLTLAGLSIGPAVEFVRLSSQFEFASSNTFTIGKRSGVAADGNLRLALNRVGAFVVEDANDTLYGS